MPSSRDTSAILLSVALHALALFVVVPGIARLVPAPPTPAPSRPLDSLVAVDLTPPAPAPKPAPVPAPKPTGTRLDAPEGSRTPARTPERAAAPAPTPRRTTTPKPVEHAAPPRRVEPRPKADTPPRTPRPTPTPPNPTPAPKPRTPAPTTPAPPSRSVTPERTRQPVQSPRPTPNATPSEGTRPGSGSEGDGQRGTANPGSGSRSGNGTTPNGQNGTEGDRGAHERGGTPGGSGTADGGTGGFNIEGLGGRRLLRRALPTNDEGVTVTLAAEILVAPDGSVRLGRWVQRGNPTLQRRAEAALAGWRFAALPAAAPQETQRGVVRFRFVAN